MEWGRQSRTSTLDTFSPVSRSYRSCADTQGLPSGLEEKLGDSRPLISVPAQDKIETGILLQNLEITFLPRVVKCTYPSTNQSVSQSAHQLASKPG